VKYYFHFENGKADSVSFRRCFAVKGCLSGAIRHREAAAPLLLKRKGAKGAKERKALVLLCVPCVFAFKPS
jgi:hypothetical protein